MAHQPNPSHAPIGVFDSGYGGLTVLSSIRKVLPQYDFIYLGDNARAPYGARSFELIYQFTLQAVKWFFEQGCQLVIIACNTASAKALRSIQQRDLPLIDPNRRVLGVIRPTVESVGAITSSNHIGILGTEGTIQSNSYNLEIEKIHPHISIVGEACPMWVPLVENKEYDKPGADYFVKQHINHLLSKDRLIDTIILGCTHYPLLIDKIKTFLPTSVTIMPQGVYVAESLADYLQRHPDMAERCSTNGTCRYFTTENHVRFEQLASIFMNESVEATKIVLE